MAKCLVANASSSSSGSSDGGSGHSRRLAVLEAARHLRKSEAAFRAAGDFQRVKDVLYMTVRKFRKVNLRVLSYLKNLTYIILYYYMVYMCVYCTDVYVLSQARLFHSLEMVTERNYASAEFKKLDEQTATNVCSRLPHVL